MSSEPSVIEYSLDGGASWRHGRTVEAWVTADIYTLRAQRAVVRMFAREWHGNVEKVTTRVLAESDPRAVNNQTCT